MELIRQEACLVEEGRDIGQQRLAQSRYRAKFIVANHASSKRVFAGHGYRWCFFYRRPIQRLAERCGAHRSLLTVSTDESTSKRESTYSAMCSLVILSSGSRPMVYGLSRPLTFFSVAKETRNLDGDDSDKC